MMLQSTDLGGVWVAGTFEQRSIENPRYGLTDPRLIDGLFGGIESASGEAVTAETALQIPAVWEIVSMIAEDIANLPLEPYKRSVNDRGETFGKEVDKKHPSFKLLAKMPNPFQEDFQFRASMIFCALLTGNAYAYVERRKKGGDPVAMWWLDPLKTCLKCDNSQRNREQYFYETTDNTSGTPVPIPFEDVVHIKGPTFDGMMGLEILRFARDTFGMSLAAQRYTSRFFKNGVQAGGFLEVPHGTTKKAADALEEGFKSKFSNPDNHFRTVILRDGVKWVKNTFDATEADLTNLRNQAKIDVCSFYGINPSKVGVPGYSSYNSQEQANRQYHDSCLSRVMAREIAGYEMKLLTEDEFLSDAIKLEHNTKKLLQMNLIERYQAYQVGIRSGFLNPNDALAAESMPPRPGGDVYAAAPELGMSGGGADNKSPTPEDPKEPGKEPGERSIEDLRIIFGVTNHARTKAKTSQGFCDWIKGRLASHRTDAIKLGVAPEMVDRMLSDFENLKADDATIAGQVDKICKRWEAGR